MGQDGRIAATASFDGRFEVFFQNSLGVHHYWQAPDTLKWTYFGEPYLPVSYTPTDFSTFDPRDPGYRATIVAGRDGAGRIMAAWLSSGKVYYVATSYPGSSLNVPGSQIYGLENARYLALGQHDDGTLEVFSLDKDGHIFSCKQTQNGIWAWDGALPWDPGGDQVAFSKITVGKVAGKLAVFGLVKSSLQNVSAVGSVLVLLTPGGNGEYSTFEEYFGHDITALVAAESVDHRLELFALGSDAQIYHRYELVGGGVTNWGLLTGFETGALAGSLQVVSTGDGRMWVIAAHSHNFGTGQPDKNFSIAVCGQENPNGGFAQNFDNLNFQGNGPTAVTSNPNGSVALFKYQTAGRPYSLMVSIADVNSYWGWPQYVVDEIYG